QFLTDDESKAIKGNEANSLKITYSNGGISDSKFEYDAALGKYKRFSGGNQTADLETNDPILVDNIFIIETVHRFIDSYGRR
ncbi:DUF3048 C-terminal domain-containing protein, partial [Alkalihalophilus pseudofirmus]